MQELIDKRLLHLFRKIIKDKINLISGAHTSPFVEMLWTVMSGDTTNKEQVGEIIFAELVYNKN